MKKFKVIIEETISQEFEVIAEDFDSAEKIATKNYNNGIFVIDSKDVQYKEMAIIDEETKEETGWFPF